MLMSSAAKVTTSATLPAVVASTPVPATRVRTRDQECDHVQQAHGLQIFSRDVAGGKGQLSEAEKQGREVLECHLRSKQRHMPDKEERERWSHELEESRALDTGQIRTFIPGP